MILQKESLETNNRMKNYDRHLMSAEKRTSEKLKIKHRLWLSSYLLMGFEDHQWRFVWPLLIFHGPCEILRSDLRNTIHEIWSL